MPGVVGGKTGTEGVVEGTTGTEGVVEGMPGTEDASNCRCEVVALPANCNLLVGLHSAPAVFHPVYNVALQQ